MNNNDVLRKIRFIFDLSDSKMMSVFEAAEFKVNRQDVSSWLKQEDAAGFEAFDDMAMAIFLNGFINQKRGKKDGPAQIAEKRINNNLVFLKLKIALNLKAEDILEVLALVDFRISKHELSAFFRKPTHKHFRKCKDQVLRNFLHGLQIKFRPETSKPS